MRIQTLANLKKLIYDTRYATYATINQDGSPHASPMFFMYDENLRCLYWGSHHESAHITNMLRSRQAFAVIFGSIEDKSYGLYFKLENCRLVVGKELIESLIAHNIARAKIGKKPLQPNYYSGSCHQKMYAGDITEVTSHDIKRGKNGLIIKDFRYPVNKTFLINKPSNK